MHPPKVETFDVRTMTNTDPKGFVRAVDEFRVEPFGLYLSRDFPGHPKIEWIESWLLPAIGVRVTDWWWRPGHERDQDFYVDIVDIRQDGDVWRTEDHYLDIVVRRGRGSEVIDVDEFVEAVVDGLLGPAAAGTALATSYRVLDGLAAHRHDLNAWLATLAVPLRWRRR